MKRNAILILVLVLTVVTFVGCGCRKNMPMDTKPTTQPTTEATRPTTEATTEATTRPSVTTTPTGETYDNGNGPLPSDDTGAAGDNSRNRPMPGGMQ